MSRGIPITGYLPKTTVKVTNSRIPGPQLQKLELLATLDEMRFPDLVCDVLYFCHGYRELRSVGGPGDGRRDLTGVDPTGRAVVVQCKFHRDTRKAVGARDTDEIVIALAKFGAKAGVFATTGRVSPQAVREYERDYPELSLKLFSGEELFDALLGNSLLRQVWLEDERLALRTTRILAPLIFRSLGTDHTRRASRCLNLDALKQLGIRNVEMTLPEADFSPYREPSSPSMIGEAIGAHVSGTGAYRDVAAPLFSIYDVGSKMIAEVLSAVGPNAEILQVRVGRLKVGSGTGDDLENWLELPDSGPQTYIVASGMPPITEREWVVPETSHTWIFPDRFGSMEADWIGWFSPEIECVLMPHLEEPLVPRHYPGSLIAHKMKAVALAHSFFLGCSDEHANALLQTLDEDKQPDWSSRGVATERVLGWLHPAYHGGFAYRTDENDAFRLSSVEELSKEQLAEVNCFEQTRATVFKISHVESRSLSSDAAIAISRLGADPLLEDITTIEHRAAQLYHFFEELPSPLKLDERRHVYVQVWDVPTDLNSFRAWAVKGKLREASPSAWVNAKISPANKRLMPIVSISYDVPPELSVAEAMNREREQMIFEFAAISNLLKHCWPESRNATEQFWREDIGVIFRTSTDQVSSD